MVSSGHFHTPRIAMLRQGKDRKMMGRWEEKWILCPGASCQPRVKKCNTINISVMSVKLETLLLLYRKSSYKNALIVMNMLTA